MYTLMPLSLQQCPPKGWENGGHGSSSSIFPYLNTVCLSSPRLQAPLSMVYLLIYPPNPSVFKVAFLSTPHLKTICTSFHAQATSCQCSLSLPSPSTLNCHSTSTSQITPFHSTHSLPQTAVPYSTSNTCINIERRILFS